MELVYEKNLSHTLRNLCDSVKERLWIASPFIGKWSALRKVLGIKWIDNDAVDVRIITDISGNGDIDSNTFTHLSEIGKIKSITGLHAKIYIIDNQAIVSSANLTSTAFSKRYEVGISLSANETKSLLNLYDNWWNDVASEISPNWSPRMFEKNRGNGKEETSGNKLETLWPLPEDPGDPFENINLEFRDYQLFLNYYSEFAEIYGSIQRIWPNTYLFFETDAFLNFLFHDADGQPSEKYRKSKPRNFNKHERENEVIKYARKFKKWADENSEENDWRDKRHEIITRLLREDRVRNLSIKEITSVVYCLNCMNSMPIVRAKFLNKKNNDIDSIRNAWYNLLHGPNTLQKRMSECKKALKWFGNSSVQEILGFYYPERFPIRNSNSNSGLRFFGYKISAY